MITYIYFLQPVIVGAASIEMWSGRAGETNETMRKITVEECKPDGVVLKYRAGAQQHDIEVPRANIRQITRDVSKPVQAAETGAKK